MKHNSSLLRKLLGPIPFALRFEALSSESLELGVSKRAGEGLPCNLTSSRQIEIQARDRLKAEVKSELVQKGVPEEQIRISLSHTRFYGKEELWYHQLLVLAAPVPVGVDLEAAQRPISARLSKRIISEGERVFGLAPLEFWVVKEALFKANPINQGTLLSHYQVIGWNEAEQIGTAKFSKAGSIWNFNFQIIRENSWLIAIAVQKVF